MNCLTKIGFCLFFPLIFFSCELDSSKDVGNGLNPLTGSFGIIYTDTLTLQTSTLLVDSVVTAAGSSLIVGQYNDPQQGKVTARSFFQVRYASKTDLGPSPQVDSVRFLLYHDSTGTSQVTQKLRLYRLTGNIEGRRNYLNSDQISFETNPVAEYVFNRPANRPKSTDTLRIPVNNAVGRELIQAYTSTLSEADFVRFFKGFALTSASEGPSTGITSFRTLGVINNQTIPIAGIQVYYRNTTDNTPRNLFFTIENLYNQGLTTMFNQVIYDRTSTPLRTLQRPYDAVPASATGEQTYIQSGVGLKTKVVIPYFQKLRQNRNIIINDAKLIIDPIRTGVFASSQSLPTRLTLYEVTNTGRIPVFTQMANNTQVNYYVPLGFILGSFNAELGEDGRLCNNTGSNNGKYVFNITDYLQRLIVNAQLPANQQLPDKGLIISIPSGSPQESTPFGANEVTVRGVTLGSQRNTQNPLKLVVYYTYVNDK